MLYHSLENIIKYEFMWFSLNAATVENFQTKANQLINEMIYLIIYFSDLFLVLNFHYSSQFVI